MKIIQRQQYAVSIIHRDRRSTIEESIHLMVAFDGIVSAINSLGETGGRSLAASG